MNSRYILVNSLSKGGAERVVSDIVNNNDIKLILIWPVVEFNVEKSKFFSLLNKKGFFPFDLIVAFFKLFAFVRNNRIRTINSHLFYANYLNIAVSLFTKHRSICTHCVSFSSKFTKNEFRFFIHYALIYFLFRHASVHTYKSKAMKYEYEEMFSLTEGIVIYNPINIDTITKLSKNNIELSLVEKKCPRVLVVGRFHKTKRQDVIIEALCNLDVEVFFLGDGDLLLKCKAIVEEKGVQKKFHFLGNVDNPYPYYRECDYYISNSNSEGFPNALIEAISLGCYPIHSDCYLGPREILSLFKTYSPLLDNRNDFFEVHPMGILFQVNSEKAILNAISYAVKSHCSVNDECRIQMLEQLNSNVIYLKYIELLDA